MAGQIIIVGVGALGSHLALLGRNWKQGLKVIDFDLIESKNIMSQFHTNMSKGKNKAQALQQAMQGLFGIKIETNPHKLTAENAGILLKDATLVVDCTDNAAARKVIQTYTRNAGIPCVHGALDASGTFARIVWSEHFVLDEEGAPGQATCEDGENLPFHGLAASQLAVVVQRFLRKGDRQSFQVSPAGAIRLM